MAKAAQLDLVRKAILAGTLGNIQWKESAAALVRGNRDLLGLTPHAIRQFLREFVAAGHDLDVREENREEYRIDHAFWYRAVIGVPDLSRDLFVEVILVDDDPAEPFVEIVSAHC